MNLLKRFLMILSMIALTSFAADKGKNLFDRLDVKRSSTYKRAVQLYKTGCKNIEQGFVEDSNKCIKAYSLLNKVISENQNTFDANFYLSKIYLYQPQSFNWNTRYKSKKKIKTMGLRHLKKALQINPKHKEARQLLSQLEIKKASSLKTQGLKN